MNRVFAHFLFLAIAIQQAEGQQLQITNYSSKEGVPVYGANSIFQDSKGWMWFTTGYEVMKYDGHRFRAFPLAVHTIMNFCYKVLEVDNEIWILAAPYTLRVSGDSLRKVANIDENTVIADHIQLKDQDFFICKDGLYQLKDQRLVPYINNSSLSLNSSIIAFNDSLLVSYEKGEQLIVFNMRQRSVHPIRIAVTDITKDGANRFFMMVKGEGIVELTAIDLTSSGRSIFTNDAVSFKDNNYERFVIDGKGDFWTFEQFKELVSLSKTNYKRSFNESNGLPSSWFNDMYVDREKNLWIGFNGGLCKIRNTTWERYTTGEALLSNHILFCSQGPGLGQVFVATQNGVNIVSNNKVKPVTQHGKPFVCNMLIASAAVLYYSRDSNLYSGAMDTLRGTVVSEKKIAKLPGTCIQLLDHKGYILIATTHGLYAYSQNQLVVLGTDTSYFKKILLNKEGRLWAGNFAYDLQCFKILFNGKTIQLKKLFSLDSISPAMPRIVGTRALAETRDGTILVGTRNNGLFVLTVRNDKLTATTHYGKENGLPSNTVWDIVVDRDDACWIATMHGLIRMQKQNGIWNLRNEGTKRQIYQATLLFEDDNRNIWVASHPGIVMMKNDRDTVTNRFDIAVTGITINDQYLAPDKTKAQRLKYSENNVSIEFSANTYSQEESVLYSFRLHDNDEWTTPAATHQVNYSALRPGSYRFRVKAVNAEGEWSRNEAGFNFSIVAPFWQQAWFIAFVVAVVAAATYALYRYRLKRVKELFEMRNVIASDLHDEIGSTLTSINILSKVSHKNLEKDRQKASSLLKKVITQSQEIQENMSDIVWSIRPDNDKMENIILRMQEYVSHTLEPENIRVSFSVGDRIAKESLSMQQRRDFFLVFKEAINNIAKYAMCSTVEIRLGHHEGNICLVIRDNGVGFDPDAKIVSNGLRNMRHRAALLKGKISIRSVLGNGTSVELEMPATS
jgi:signal transduction histidine kinase/ligand-binding sensor domain-containing protein